MVLVDGCDVFFVFIYEDVSVLDSGVSLMMPSSSQYVSMEWYFIKSPDLISSMSIVISLKKESLSLTGMSFLFSSNVIKVPLQI